MSKSLSYPPFNLPSPGVAQALVPGVAWLRMPLPFALDHVNVWLIEDGDAWTLVDTGIALESVQVCWEQALLGRQVSRLLVTHFHPDHVGLAAWLVERLGIALHMTLGEYLMAHAVRLSQDGIGVEAMLALYRLHGLDEVRLTALKERGNAYVRGVPSLPRQFRRLRDGDVLSLGGRTWQVLVGYGHSPEHAAFYCRELGVLISGDILLPGISSNVSALALMAQDDPLQDYLLSLEKLLALPDETLVLPSHGRPFRGIHARVKQLVRHHSERCATLARSCSAPKSAGELLEILFPRELDTHQVQFAMGEAIAHLTHLEQAGTLQRQLGDDGICRFINPN